jgi:hypothetical protein
MEYDELIDKIKDALKITKLEIYEKADLQAILKEAWCDGYETGFEDGSLDVNELQQFIDENNLKIKIIVYRQGATKPELKNF